MVVVCIPILAMYFVTPDDIVAFCDESFEPTGIFEPFVNEARNFADTIDIAVE